MKKLVSHQKMAQQILAKIAPTLASIESMENTPSFELISQPLKDPLADSKEVLGAAKAAADQVMKAAAIDDSPELPAMKAITESIASAKRAIVVITNLMAAIARAR